MQEEKFDQEIFKSSELSNKFIVKKGENNIILLVFESQDLALEGLKFLKEKKFKTEILQNMDFKTR